LGFSPVASASSKVHQTDVIRSPHGVACTKSAARKLSEHNARASTLSAGRGICLGTLQAALAAGCT